MIRGLIAFAAAVAALACASFEAAAEQPVKHRVGFISRSSESGSRPVVGAFRDELRKLGHAENENLAMEWRWANGRVERLAELAAGLARARVEVIVAPGTVETRAAQQATRSIPLVMVNVGDPVNSGFIRSMARPGGNITGLSFIFPELSAKQLEFFTAGLPGVSTIAVLWNPSNPSHPPALRSLERAAAALGVEVRPVSSPFADDLEHAFAKVSASGTKALFILGEPRIFQQRTRLAELARKHGLATMFNLREHVEAGGLMAYGVHFPELYRRAAVYVDRILKGANPADLPVEQPDKFELVVNLRTARALGLTIPPSLLLRADSVVE